MSEQERPDVATLRDVVIDGQWYQAPADPIDALLAMFERRVIMGDATSESDEYISSLGLGDFSGGIGIEESNESSDLSRFWFGSAETRYPNHVTLPPEVIATRPDGVAVSATCVPLGDVAGANGVPTRFYVAFDQTAYGWDESNDTWYGTANALGALPVNKAVRYKGYLYVPCGTGGLKRLSETGAGVLLVESVHSSVTPACVQSWSRKLFVCQTNGQIKYSVNGGLLNNDWKVPIDQESGDPLALDTSEIPRHLVPFFTRQGEPALYLITDRGAWGYDHAGAKLEMVGGLRLPPHPDNGLGAGVWRAAEDLWISQGVGGTRLTSGAMVVPLVGLDRDDGIPIEYRGKTADFEPEYNGMYALIAGDAGAIGGATWGPDGPASGDDDTTLPTGSAYSMLACWSGIGWHVLWTSGEALGTPTRCVVSALAQSGGYRLWWGVGADAYTMPLRRTFHSPKQGAKAGVDRFAAAGYLETSRYDMNMEGFDKLAVRAVVHADDATAQETISLSYRTDLDATYRSLGTVETPGKHWFDFDPNGDLWGEGQPFEWAQFRVDLARGLNIDRTPVLRKLVLQFMKCPQLASSIVFPIQLPKQRYQGRSAADQITDLEDLVRNRRLVRLVVNDVELRVRLSAMTGPRPTGPTGGGTQKTLTFVEIPTAAAMQALYDARQMLATQDGA